MSKSFDSNWLDGWGEPSPDALDAVARKIRSLEDEGYSVDPWVLHPGQSFKSQVSNDDKVLAVLRGAAHIDLPGGPRELTAGVVVSIPHGVVHTVTVIGEQDVYTLVASRTPQPIPPEAFRKPDAE